MSKKNRTATLAVLCGALIVCVGGYFAARGISAAEEKKNAEEETQSIPVTEYSADGMQTLSYYTADNGDTLSFTKTDSGWTLDAEPDYPLNQTNLNDMAKAISSVSAKRMVEKSEYTLSDFGLDDETVRVRVTAGYRDANGVPFSVTVRISEASSFSSDCYLSVEGNDAIYMVAEDVANAFAYGKSDLLQTESLPQINSETLYSVAVTAGGKTNEITDKTGLDALASLYGNLTVKSMAYYVQNAETLAKTGLDAPVQLKFSYKKEVQQQQDDGSVATVTVEASSTVLLGASFADASGNEKTYFTFDSLSYIYEATKETADFLTAYADYVPALTEEESSQAEG